MDVAKDESRQLLRDSAQRFMRQQYSFAQRRALLDARPGLHPAIWRQFAELGWLSVAFTEESGGLGGDSQDIALLGQVFGEALLVEPWQVNLLCGTLLAHLGDTDQCHAWLLPMLDGAHQLALAHDEPGRRFGLHNVATRAEATAEGYQLQGDKAVVLNGDQADTLLVTAMLDDALALFAVPAASTGLSRTGYATVDGMSAAELHFAAVNIPATARLGTGDVTVVLEQAFDVALLALCAEAVGIMQALVNDTVEYCKTRRQFGVPIGSFQVLQHRMADMFIHTERARALLEMAATQADGHDPLEARRAVSALKAGLGVAARYVGQQAVQLHGGMGMTDELRIGHYFKRLTRIEQMWGNEDYHLRRLDRLTALPGAA